LEYRNPWPAVLVSQSDYAPGSAERVVFTRYRTGRKNKRLVSPSSTYVGSTVHWGKHLWPGSRKFLHEELGFLSSVRRHNWPFTSQQHLALGKVE